MYVNVPPLIPEETENFSLQSFYVHVTFPSWLQTLKYRIRQPNQTANVDSTPPAALETPIFPTATAYTLILILSPLFPIYLLLPVA